MRSLTRLLVATAVLATVACGSQSCRSGPASAGRPAGSAAAKPHADGIVLVTVDGWWDPKTGVDPFTTASLPGSIRYTNVMTPCPQVRPAVVSILTGQTPDRTGIRDDLTRPLPDDVPYLPDLLKKHGWQTGAFVASPHVGLGSGLERGFTIFDAPRDLPIGPFRYQPRLRPADEPIANLATWVKSLAPDRPYFAWVHLAFGGPATRKPPKTPPPSAAEAWKSLSSELSGTGRLHDAAVFVVGTAGRVDPAKAEDTGYFLVPDVLRVPLLARPAKQGGTIAWAAGAPLASADLAAAIVAEAGLSTTFPDAASPTEAPASARIRFAWTWRGTREFQWPVQAAALKDDALVVRDGAHGTPTVASWTGGAGAAAGTDAGLAGALAARPSWDEPRTQAGPDLPADLSAILAKNGIAIPKPAALAPPPDLATRLKEMPVLLRARAAIQMVEGPAARAACIRALEIDPANAGILIEDGQFLALFSRPKRARARLEAALKLYPYDAEGWHWMGHVFGLQKHDRKAEAVLKLSDFLTPHNPDVLYDLACTRSLLHDPEGAVAYLQRAWTAGYRDADHIEGDPDLRNLRADPRYARFMQGVVR